MRFHAVETRLSYLDGAPGLKYMAQDLRPCLCPQALSLLHYSPHGPGGSSTDEQHVSLNGGRLQQTLLDSH